MHLRHRLFDLAGYRATVEQFCRSECWEFHTVLTYQSIVNIKFYSLCLILTALALGIYYTTRVYGNNSRMSILEFWH